LNAGTTTGGPTFGDLLGRHRVAARLTQEELAERAGVSDRGISDLERGVKAVPRKDTVQLLAEALHGSPQGALSLRQPVSVAPLPRLRSEVLAGHRSTGTT
jgi:transcriptional regulator with XRE-family HTH domain